MHRCFFISQYAKTISVDQKSAKKAAKNPNLLSLLPPNVSIMMKFTPKILRASIITHLQTWNEFQFNLSYVIPSLMNIGVSQSANCIGEKRQLVSV